MSGETRHDNLDPKCEVFNPEYFKVSFIEPTRYDSRLHIVGERQIIVTTAICLAAFNDRALTVQTFIIPRILCPFPSTNRPFLKINLATLLIIISVYGIFATLMVTFLRLMKKKIEDTPSGGCARPVC